MSDRIRKGLVFEIQKLREELATANARADLLAANIDVANNDRMHLMDRIAEETARADAYRDSLRSIAANSCCEGCQEARRVAIKALEQGEGDE